MTYMTLLMVDQTVKTLVSILCDVLVKVGSFIFPTDFVILDCEVNFKALIILRRPFLATGKTLVELEIWQMKLRLNNEHVTFNICKSIWQLKDIRVVSVIDTVYDDALIVPFAKRLGVEALVAVIMNFDRDDIDEYDKMVSELYGRGSYFFAPKKLDLDLKSKATLPA